MATQAVTQPMPLTELRPSRSRMRSLASIARQKPIGAVAAAICLCLVLVALGADFLAPQTANNIDPIQNPRLLAPSLDHPLGTDNLFRDVLSRIIIGSRISLGIGFTAVALG